MKKILLISFGIFLLVFFAFAGGPPDAVQKNFEQKYPRIAKVAWYQDNDTNDWVADFSFNGSAILSSYSKDGSWVKTREKIPISNTPKPVIDALHRTYPGWQINTAVKIESANGELTYEHEIQQKKETKEVVFKENGIEISSN